MKVFTAVLASALFLAPAAMFAQTQTPGAHDYNINQRKVDQQDRIANGVKSGQLTAGEVGFFAATIKNVGDTKIGDTVTEMSTGRPSLATRTVSKCSMRSPFLTRLMICSSSCWRSGGMSRVIDWPIISLAE